MVSSLDKSGRRDRGLPTAGKEPTSSGAGVTPACDTQRTGSGM